MYGRNNIFANSNQGNTSNYGTNNNNSSYGSSSNYNQSYRTNNQRGLGSYRLDYKYEEPPNYLLNCVTQWKDNAPASIVAREQTIHLTTTQLRIEDYYLIRKKELKSNHETRLRDAIRNESFNEDIAKIQFPRLPPVSEEKPLDMDAIRSSRSNHTNSGSAGYNRDNDSRGNMFSGSNNNVSTNIFSQNSSNRYGNPSSNTYGNNNYGGSNSTYGNSGGGSGNMYVSSNRDRDGGGNNVFSNNANRSNNAFSNNTGSYGSSNNNNSVGNIFNSNRGGNTGGNLFSNSNNSSSSNNIFANRNNNSNSSNNIFSNNNNNNSNSGGNNIFGNRSGGNNLFSSSSNNSNNISIPPEFLLNFQYVLQQTNKIMQSVHQNSTLGKKEEQENTRNNLTPFEELAKHDDPIDINRFLHDTRRRPPVVQGGTITLVKPDWFEEYEQLKKSQIHNQSRIVSNNSKLINNTRGVVQSQIISNPNGSRMYNNEKGELKKTESRVIGNRQEEPASVRKSTIRTQKMVEEWPGPCMCDFDLEIEWEDDDRHQMKTQKIRAKLELQQMKQRDPGWQKSTVQKLKHLNKSVRSDAQILVISCSQKEEIASAQFVIKGRLRQRIINLPSTYKVCYSQIKEGMLYNLVISNQYGCIAWEEPICAYDLDFVDYSQLSPLSIGQNEVICQLDALNIRCSVNFVGLPKYLEEAYFVSETEFQNRVGEFKRFVSQKTNGAFEVIDIWKKQKGSGYLSGWKLKASYFPRLQEQIEAD